MPRENTFGTKLQMVSERRRISKGALNLTPLIDIVFLLLVFFMLTAHFIEEEQIDIQLPKAQSSDSLSNDQTITILLTPSGQVLVEGIATTMDELQLTLRDELRNSDEKLIRLKGDYRAQFGNAVAIIDAARLAGAESLDIQTEQP